MSQFKPGDIVRYNHGSTALAKLTSQHTGGWYGEQCMGGTTYVSANFHLCLADKEDLHMWNKCAWHRGCGIPPIWRPLIKKQEGCWVVRRHHGVPDRWKAAYEVMVEQAMAFAFRLNFPLAENTPLS